MKKILVAATVIGLIAAPTAVFADHGNDDARNVTTGVAQPVAEHKDRVDNDQNDNDNDQNDDRNSPVTTTPTPVTTTPTAPVSGTAVSQAEAATIAQNRLPGKTIIRVQTENEEGIAVFSVRFSDGSRVDVAANSGTITRVDDQTANNDNDRHDNSGPGNHNDGNRGHGHDDNDNDD